MQRLGMLALAVYAASLCGAVIVAHAPDHSRQPEPRAAPAAEPTRRPGPTVGFALNLHYADQLDRHLQALDELARLGVDSVEILTPAFQRDGAAEVIDLYPGLGRGPRRAQLVALLRHARQRRLATTLMPVVLFTDPRGNEWRGKISPENWDPWWHSYYQMIDYFLDIAIDADVQVFCVGSELLSTERQTGRWTTLIRHVRDRFDGKLMYSANWDHFHVPRFWQDVDLIGVSGYWDLTTLAGGDDPTDEQLRARWRQIRVQLLAVAAEQDRPLVLTEVGYPSLPWALKDPWNYVNSDSAAADANAQARGYAAFLAAWSDDLAAPGAPGALGGVFFYEWDPYHEGGSRDTGYGVRGKPALNVLQQWLQERRGQGLGAGVRGQGAGEMTNGDGFNSSDQRSAVRSQLWLTPDL